MRDTLHLLPVAQRISYRIAVLVWRCLLGSAPGYLCERCRPVSGLPGWRALRSSVTGQLLVPRAKTSTRQRRAFSIVGPSTWNGGLPLEIRLLPKNNESAFCRLLRLICIAVVGLGAPLSRFLEGAPYKFLNEWMNESKAQLLLTPNRVITYLWLSEGMSVSVRVFVWACVRACVCVCELRV